VGKQGDGVSYFRRVAAYNSVIRKVARRTGSLLIDWPGFIKRKGLKSTEYLGDSVHLSVDGNHRYAEAVLETLGRTLSRKA
jgi:hypothetical protein